MKKAKLIILDEVNVKFENLDAATRRSLAREFKYQLPYARHLPSVRLGRWDGCIAFFQVGGSTYLNLLPEILPRLEQFGYTVELEDRRLAQPNFEFDPVTEHTYSDRTWPDNHPIAGEPVLLRDYQVQVINSFLSNTQCLQEVATAAGKTIMTAALSERVERYGRSIIIVPNKSLVTQTEIDYRNMGLDVGVFFGDRKEPGHKHTICTWQSLNTLLKKTKSSADDSTLTMDDFLADVVCVIVDECHAIKAEVLRELLTGAMAHIPIRWGLTGTIPKEQFEFASLHTSIGLVINRLAANELQERGVLAQCHVQILQTQETAEYKNYQQELSYLVTDERRLDWLANRISQMQQTGNTLILVDRVATGQALAERLPGSVFVSGSTKTAARKEQYDSVQTSSDKILIATFGLASTGINIPRIFNLVLLEPGKSFVRVIQSIGRGIRRAKDKDFVQIYDITSSCKFSKRHLSKRRVFYKDANYPYSVEKVRL